MINKPREVYSFKVPAEFKLKYKVVCQYEGLKSADTMVKIMNEWCDKILKNNKEAKEEFKKLRRLL